MTKTIYLDMVRLGHRPILDLEEFIAYERKRLNTYMVSNADFDPV